MLKKKQKQKQKQKNIENWIRPLIRLYVFQFADIQLPGRRADLQLRPGGVEGGAGPLPGVTWAHALRQRRRTEARAECLLSWGCTIPVQRASGSMKVMYKNG